MPSNMVSKSEGTPTPQATYALVVYYFDDSSEFAVVIAALDDHDPANFNQFPTCRFDVDSGHSDDSICGEISETGYCITR